MHGRSIVVVCHKKYDCMVVHDFVPRELLSTLCRWCSAQHSQRAAAKEDRQEDWRECQPGVLGALQLLRTNLVESLPMASATKIGVI
jgi:hypothetical protein